MKNMKTKITKTRFFRKIAICILLYLAGLTLGFLLLFFVQQHSHADMFKLAETISDEVSQKGLEQTEIEFEDVVSKNTGTANTNILFHETGAAAPMILYESESPIPLQQIHALSRSSHNERPRFFLTLNGHPAVFTAIVAIPTAADSNLHGSIYVTRIIHYLPSVIGTFVIFYSLIYLILLLYLRLQRKTNARISDIYNTYIANISHELKTPISSIQALTAALCEGLVEDESTQQRYYGIIDRESKRLEQSVLDLIALSKLQDHQLNIHRSSVSMTEILPAIQERYASFCDCVGIHFFIDESLWTLAGLYTNPDRITQLFQILVDNAIKFSSEGDSITLSAVCDAKKATICIADTGCGMDEETISHIFDRFYRGTNAAEKQGSGLGLAIAKELVHALGETIRAESIPGQGSHFFFTISYTSRTNH